MMFGQFTIGVVVGTVIGCIAMYKILQTLVPEKIASAKADVLMDMAEIQQEDNDD